MDVLKRTRETDEVGQASPSNKRQAVEPQPDESSQLDVERFQKEAIWRRMQEYKRECESVQDKLKRSTEDVKQGQEHVRVVETWWDELLNQLRLLTNHEFGNGSLHRSESSNMPDSGSTDYALSALEFNDDAVFSKHLETRKRQIIDGLRSIATRISQHEPFSVDPKLLESRAQQISAKYQEAQVRIRSLEAETKHLSNEIARLSSSNQALAKALDRKDSSTLSKIAAVAHNGAQDDKQEGDEQEKKPESKTDGDGSLDEGISLKLEKDNEALEALEAQKAEHEALIQKLRDDLRELAHKRENTQETSALEHAAAINIEDSDQYKALKIDLEQSLSSLDHARSIQASTSGEIESLRAQRSKFMNDVEQEKQDAVKEIQTQLSATEKDLARLRGARDDLNQQLQLRSSQDQQKAATSAEMQQLIEAKEARINALESKIARLEAESSQHSTGDVDTTLVQGGNIDELKTKLSRLEKQNKSLSQEIPAMEAAFNKAVKASSTKLAELVGREEKIAKAQAEKAKADQRYFAAMKAKDMLANEIKTLKVQTSSSKDTITKLQDSQSATQKKMELVEQRASVLQSQHDAHVSELLKKEASERKLQNDAQSARAHAERVQKQFEANKKNLEDEVASRLFAEQDAVALKARLHQIEQQYSKLKKLKGSDDSTELTVYRQMAKCGVCGENWRNRTITLCGHTFCKECVDQRIQTRQRRCPVCNLAFGTGDVIAIHL